MTENKADLSAWFGIFPLRFGAVLRGIDHYRNASPAPWSRLDAQLGGDHLGAFLNSQQPEMPGSGEKGGGFRDDKALAVV